MLGWVLFLLGEFTLPLEVVENSSIRLQRCNGESGAVWLLSLLYVGKRRKVGGRSEGKEEKTGKGEIGGDMRGIKEGKWKKKERKWK